jgi:hypothetical protein
MYFPIMDADSEQKRDTAIVRLLLEAGADPNVQSDEGLTPKMGSGWVALRIEGRVSGEPAAISKLPKRAP